MPNPLDGAVHYLGSASTDGLLGPFGRILERSFNTYGPNKFFQREEYEQLFISGMMNPEHFKTFMLFEGYDVGTFERDYLRITQWNEKDKILEYDPKNGKRVINYMLKWLQHESYLPSIEEIILYYRQGQIDLKLAHRWLQRHGIQEWDLRYLILQQVNEFPTVQDLIQFSVRHGFEPDILSTFGYAREIPKTYLDWAKKIGLGGDSKVEITDATDSNGNPIPTHNASWAEQHWFSHWVLPSLGDAYEMLHRLYPDSDFGPSPDYKQGLEFTPELLALFQRAQDIPQYWRQRLQAISFLPLSRVDVRRMFQLRIIDESQVYHSYRAQGYNDQNSKNLLKYAQKSREQTDLKEELWPKAQQICELRTLGILDDDSVLKYTDKLNIPRVDVQDYLANCQLSKQVERIKNVMKAIERSFIKGIANTDQIQSSLQDLGMTEEAINLLIQEWEIIQQFQFKEDNAAEAQKWYEAGIIDIDEFVNRLQNLKISDGSILHMVALADMTIAGKQAKQSATIAKELAAKQKELVKEEKAAIKDAQKSAKDQLKAMLASSTQVNLKAWWKKKIITADDVTNRLTALNYGEADIQRWLASFG